MKNPIQPLAPDADGVIRFKRNAIVVYLFGLSDMNVLSRMEFTADDRQQFAQLTGYSLSGYRELRSYVSDDDYQAAAKMARDGLTEDKARIAALEAELLAIRTTLREPMARLFGLHPDDLNVPGAV